MMPGRRRLFRSIRARLTVWYAFVLTAILVVYAAGVYVFLRQNLYRELDRRLHDDFEAAEASLARDADGRVIRSRDRHGHDNDADGERWLEVWSLEGELLHREGPEQQIPATSGSSGMAPFFDGVRQSREEARRAEVESAETGAGTILRVRTGTHRIAGTRVVIRVARSEAPLRHELGEFLAGMGLGLPAAVLLACLGGFFLAGRALKPVGQMAARAKTITADRLEERLPIENPDDELGRLGTVFNHTLARLERSFESLRRFTADAAHELRTPLTALRSVGEVAVRGPRTERAYREVIGSMLEESDRLGRLVETLLILSRGDDGRVELQASRLELGKFARATVEDLDVLADEKDQHIVVDAEPDVYVHADPRILRQAVSNIVDNAIRHSPRGAPIRVAIHRTARERTAEAVEAVLEVTDEGPGIPAEHHRRIFERFYRVDKARSREEGGVGLGLSIAQWAVQANGGSIELESRVGVGSTFRIRLPLRDEERVARPTAMSTMGNSRTS